MDTVVLMTGVGGVEKLEVSQISSKQPGPGMARVRNLAIGVNFIDIYHRTGLYPLSLPATLGVEAAGVVEALGEGVIGFSIGDRVAYAVRRSALMQRHALCRLHGSSNCRTV